MWWVTTDVAFSVCGRFGLWPFRFVAVPVCGRSGLWPFRFVAVSVCGRSGLWPFRFVAVSVVAVSVCGRYDLLPVRQMKFSQPRHGDWHWILQGATGFRHIIYTLHANIYVPTFDITEPAVYQLPLTFISFDFKRWERLTSFTISAIRAR